MKKSFIECENCKKSYQTEPATYGGTPGLAYWITVRKFVSSSDEEIPSGESHFCTDNCLREFLNKRTSK